MTCVTVHNDGEIAVQCFAHDDGDISFGSIQRVHTIDGHTVEQATQKEFLQDMPVNQEFLENARQNEFIKDVEQGIADALAERAT